MNLMPWCLVRGVFGAAGQGRDNWALRQDDGKAPDLDLGASKIMQHAALRSTASPPVRVFGEAAPRTPKKSSKNYTAQQSTPIMKLRFTCVAWKKNYTGVDPNHALPLLPSLA